jgi:hypothetical protein
MEPNVSNNCGIGNNAGLQVARSAQAQLGRILVFSKYQIKRACKVLPLTAEIRPKKINGYRGVGVANLLDI